MNAVNRFLRYVRYDTQSAMDTGTTPSTAKQKVLGAALAEELAELGLQALLAVGDSSGPYGPVRLCVRLAPRHRRV